MKENNKITIDRICSKTLKQIAKDFNHVKDEITKLQIDNQAYVFIDQLDSDNKYYWHKQYEIYKGR